MPRLKEPFTLYSRKTKDGRDVWYYRTYDEYGIRTHGYSTGETSKTVAKMYCMKLYKEGRLIPDSNILFSIYAENWWVWGKCNYIKEKLARSPKGKPTISKTYAGDTRSRVEKHIIPYFGNYKLAQIKPHTIDTWMIKLKKSLSAKTANHCLSALRVMLNEAHRKGLIVDNPILSIKPFIEDPKVRGILTLKEARDLFDLENMLDNWVSGIYYGMNFLAASTGMRLGEIRGLLIENYHDNHIHVCHSYGENGLGPTKTREVRDVPIPSAVKKYLDEIKTSKGYLFSYDLGKSPVNATRPTMALYEAMDLIGIKEKTRKERNITFHSWRHFFNTYLRSSNVTDAKVQSVTGHKTQAMTEKYTKFRLDDYKEVIVAQEELFMESIND